MSLWNNLQELLEIIPWVPKHIEPSDDERAEALTVIRPGNGKTLLLQLQEAETLADYSVLIDALLRALPSDTHIVCRKGADLKEGYVLLQDLATKREVKRAVWDKYR